MIARSVSRRPGEGGQAAVELVLVLPVVLLALLMVVQLGVLVRSQVLVVHAAREGARAAAIDGGAEAAAAGAARQTPGLEARRLAVSVRQLGDALPRVGVRVTYRAPTDVALIGPLLGDVTLSEEVVMLVEEPTAAPG